MSAVMSATAWCTLVGSVVCSVAVFAVGVRVCGDFTRHVKRGFSVLTL